MAPTHPRTQMEAAAAPPITSGTHGQQGHQITRHCSNIKGQLHNVTRCEHVDDPRGVCVQLARSIKILSLSLTVMEELSERSLAEVSERELNELVGAYSARRPSSPSGSSLGLRSLRRARSGTQLSGNSGRMPSVAISDAGATSQAEEADMDALVDGHVITSVSPRESFIRDSTSGLLGRPKCA